MMMEYEGSAVASYVIDVIVHHHGCGIYGSWFERNIPASLESCCYLQADVPPIMESWPCSTVMRLLRGPGNQLWGENMLGLWLHCTEWENAKGSLSTAGSFLWYW